MAILESKLRLNFFETEIKMKMTAQTTPPRYALAIIDEETGKEKNTDS